MKKILVAMAMAVSVLLTGCDDDAKIVNANITKAADNFEITRRIVFYNGITNAYMMVIEGRCSIDTSAAGKTLHVICRTGPSEYKKHFLGLSDNVTFFAEQMLPVKASAYHYRVIFKPQTILPDLEARGSATELLDLVK